MAVFVGATWRGQWMTEPVGEHFRSACDQELS
ncbi:hypothetical protein BJY18_003040 [Amycolatopsis jiangsuensis]|uniref:Uncharacterized protein n=1 Tax=Amycolatopsis jiangsuensis TaxID=1181879 RepID=A0A840IVU2_9PSEU|nr:hypothetical protein [Amycolatopsis jiangsuensis]